MADVLLGREAELAALDVVLAGPAAGRGRLVVVEGEAGAGKTRLCEAVAELARGRAEVAWVTCWEADAVPAFWPWRRLLAALDEKLPTTAYDENPQAARVAMFDAVADRLAARSASSPLLLVVDDVQWMDELSLAFLRFLAPMLRTMPVVVVVAARTGEGDAGVSRHALHLPLPGLGVDALTELVRQVRGSVPSPEDVARLRDLTNGNPLFARELAAVPEEAPLPATVRVLLSQRVERVGAETRALLEAAALLDEPVVDVLAAVLGDAPVVRLLDEAAAAGLVTSVDGARFRFAHPLLRAVLADGLGIANRVRLHERIGTALEQLAAAGRPVELATLARHFAAAAAAGSAPVAVRYAIEAGDEAMRLLAYEQAARHFEAALGALDLAPSAADRTDVLLRLGEALVAAGRPAEARARFTAAAAGARAAGDAEALARAALAVGSGGGFEVTLFDDEQQELLRAALEVVPDGALRARLLARLSVARSLAEPAERRRAAAEEAVAVARSSGDGAALCDALAALADAAAGPADAELRVGLAQELVEVARAAGDTTRELLGRRLLVVAHLEQGDVTAVTDQVDRYAAAARRLRQPLYDWYVPFWRATLHWIEGDDAAADAALAEAEAIGREAGSDNAAMLVMTSRLMSGIDLGRPDAALLEQFPVGSLLPAWLVIARGFLLAGLGRVDEARALLDAVAAPIRDLPQDSEYLPALVQAAGTVVAVGGHPMAGWLYDALLPHRHRFTVEGIGAYCHGSVERHLAGLASVLGRDPGEHLDAARVANARGGPGLARMTSARVVPGRALFRRAGDVWEVGLDGRTAHVKDGKGMRDLALLLARPRRALAALDLVGTTDSPREQGTGEVVDAQARAAYRRRLTELEQEVDDARDAADLARAERAAAERDALVQHLTAAYGLGGRARTSGGSAERARTAVTARIRDAIRRIEAVDAELGEHLRRSVQTGTFCCYDPAVEPAWQL